jgi:hypothetical protein
LWTTVDGDGHVQPLGDGDPDVRSIVDLVTAQTRAVDNRKYSDLDVGREFATYTQRLQTELSGYGATTQAYYTKYRLQKQAVSFFWAGMEFSRDMTSCTARIRATYRVLDASAEFTQHTGLRKGAAYSQGREFKLVKVGGRWLIDALAKGDVTAVNAPKNP